MIAYPWSVLPYLAVGVLGAAAFLVVNLLFDKNVAILENRDIRDKKKMATIYILFGGILSAVVNVAANPEFGPNQYILAFGTGMGWPAIAAGIGAGKRIGEINEDKRELEKKKENLVAFLDASRDAGLKRAKEFIDERFSNALGTNHTPASSLGGQSSSAEG